MRGPNDAGGGRTCRRDGQRNAKMAEMVGVDRLHAQRAVTQGVADRAIVVVPGIVVGVTAVGANRADVRILGGRVSVAISRFAVIRVRMVVQ